MEAIKVEDVCIAYEKQIIIDGLTLSIPKGKITALIGANGCGKSTLLKSIASVMKPLRGRILLNGVPLAHQKEKAIAKQMAFLPQSPQCPAGITVKDLISFGRYPHQKSHSGFSQTDVDVIQWAMEQTGLVSMKDRAVDELSGGQRQRAWIAMTLAQQTEVILLDEPTTYLDMSYQLEVLEVIKKLNTEQEKTFVVVLHDLNHACRFADHIIGMKGGRMICQGAPSSVITRDYLQEIYGIDALLQQSQCGDYPICVAYDLMRG